MSFDVKLHNSCIMLVQGLNAPLDMGKHILLSKFSLQIWIPHEILHQIWSQQLFSVMFLPARIGYYIHFPNGFFFMLLTGPQRPGCT
jgi:hypothetical protein